MEQELEYEKQEAAKRKIAEDRLKKEKEDLELRAEERKKADEQGKLTGTDWKDQQDAERKRTEIEKEKARRAMEKTATENMKQAQIESQKKQQNTNQTTQARPDIDMSNVKEIPCMWGCKCPGFLSENPNVNSRSGPETCKHCKHAKSMHHI